MRPIFARTRETGFRGVTARDAREPGPERVEAVEVVLVAEDCAELETPKALALALATAQRLKPSASTATATDRAGRSVGDGAVGFYRYFEAR